MTIAEYIGDIEKENVKLGMNNFYGKEKLHDLLGYIKDPPEPLDMNYVVSEIADIIAILEAPVWTVPKKSKYQRKQKKKNTTT